MKTNAHIPSDGGSLDRRVPPILALRILLNGPAGFIGLVFFLIGTLAIAAFGSQVEWGKLGLDETAGGQALGVVKQVAPTGNIVNDQVIYSYTFAFKSAEGNPYIGTSYAPGVLLDAGDSVTVFYEPGQPLDAVIAGMDASPVPAFILLFLLIFPGVGGGLLFFATRTGRTNLRLLRHGQLAYGRVVGMEPTNMTVNKQRVMEVFFEYEDTLGQTQRASTKTHLVRRLQDEEVERLVYDPQDPGQAVLLDSLPPGARSLIRRWYPTF